MTTDHRRRATFIGIGAQKAASTWLYGVLPQLPGVAISEPKEIDFFSAFFDRGYEWYERHLPSGPDIVHRGDISPSYFIHPDAPARAAAYAPDLRILVTLRDPVERAYSNHLHEVKKGHVSGANLVFEQALHNNPLYLEQGRYARHLSRWLGHFPRDQVLVLFQEDIRDDGARQARRVAAFMGVEAPDQLVDRRANESVVYRNRVLGGTLWRLGRAARRRGLGGAVEAVKALPVVRSLRAANQRTIRDVVPPMTEETTERLTAFYAAEVEGLASLIACRPPWPRFADALAGSHEPADNQPEPQGMPFTS